MLRAQIPNLDQGVLACRDEKAGMIFKVIKLTARSNTISVNLCIRSRIFRYARLEEC